MEGRPKYVARLEKVWWQLVNWLGRDVGETLLLLFDEVEKFFLVDDALHEVRVGVHTLGILYFCKCNNILRSRII